MVDVSMLLYSRWEITWALKRYQAMIRAYIRVIWSIALVLKPARILSKYYGFEMMTI